MISISVFLQYSIIVAANLHKVRIQLGLRSELLGGKISASISCGIIIIIIIIIVY